jgi:hypothetical protein
VSWTGRTPAFQGQGLAVVRPNAPLLVVSHTSVFRPSRRDVFMQLVIHPSHGCAHPSTQGHSFTSLLHARGDVRHRRVSAPSSPRRAVVSVNRPLSSACLVGIGARARSASQAKCTPVQRPSCNQRRRCRGAAPTRPNEAAGVSPDCLDPTQGKWAASSAPAHRSPIGAQLARLTVGLSPR